MLLKNQKKVASPKVVTGHNAGRRHVTFALKSLAEKYQNLSVRKLSKSEIARMLTLEDCLEELTAIQSVNDLRLKRVLLKHEYSEYKENYKSIKEYETDITDKPAEILKYEYMLKCASFYYNRGDSYSSKGNHKTAKKLLSKSDSNFEKLYVYLQKITDGNPSLWMYFDRIVMFDAANAPSLTPDDAPRHITSKSHYNTYQRSPTTRYKCKILAIESAILNLKYVNEDRDSDQSGYISKKLKEILEKPFNDDYLQ